MGKILPFLLVLLFVGGAGFAAMSLRGGGQSHAEAGDNEHGGAEGSVSHVEGGEHGEEGGLAYFRFQRDFIVPVMRSNNSVDAIVLLSINLEVPEETDVDHLRRKEPKIRDAFMRTLLGLSNEGIFARNITDPEVYARLVDALNVTASEVAGDAVKSVLIVDFARQDR